MKKLCPLHVCPTTNQDVLLDGERVNGLFLLLYVHVLQTLQWNDKIDFIKPEHLANAKKTLDLDPHCIFSSILSNPIPNRRHAPLISEPKQIFWFRFMEILYDNVVTCLKLEQSMFSHSADALSILLRNYLSGIHFLLYSNPSEALSYIRKFTELRFHLLNVTEDQFFVYNPLLVTSFILWMNKLAFLVTEDLVLDEKITNIDYILQSVPWSPLKTISPNDVSDLSSMHDFLNKYNVPSLVATHTEAQNALSLIRNEILFDSAYLLNNWENTGYDMQIDWGGIENSSPLNVYE